MNDLRQSLVAIVDYGLGNLFSVKHACGHVGLEAVITSSARELLNADAIILPGVGAFGDAMASLKRLDLVSPIRELAFTKPLLGICLGMQLLLSESYEFGRHEGLGLIEGEVRKIQTGGDKADRLKVPHVGWNRLFKTGKGSELPDPWEDSLLRGLRAGEYMYFVHSYRASPADSSSVLSLTLYGDESFCSTIKKGHIFACQFHPERSGLRGLEIYKNLAGSLRNHEFKGGNRFE